MMTSTSGVSRSAALLDRIREYYACFNDRRFGDAAAMLTDDALIEQAPFQCRERGPAAYREFAELWLRAFPDLAVTIDEIVERQPGAIEVQLRAHGTHSGPLTMGGCLFKATGVTTTLRLRDLLEFTGDRVSASFVSFDLQELAHQLARVDDTQLLMHLSRLRYMEDQLRSAKLESAHRRALLDSVGRELDAARRVVRPYFTR